MEDLFIQHHENLIARYMDLYPGVDWFEAYEETEKEAYNSFGDYLGRMAEFSED